MEQGKDVIQGLLEYLCEENIIEYKKEDDSFYWISYPEGQYKENLIMKNDVINALSCKIEKHGDTYDLRYKRCHGADGD